MRGVAVDGGFQSLTWVERLSDPQFLARRALAIDSFNPSPGLNVFQTGHAHQAVVGCREFQSLTWVERLSDLGFTDVIDEDLLFQSLTWVERLSDPFFPSSISSAFAVSIPHLG